MCARVSVCVEGGGKLLQTRGNSTKEGSISAGQRPPCCLDNGSNPRILMRQPFKGLWTLEKAPHTGLLYPSSPLHRSPSPTSNPLGEKFGHFLLSARPWKVHADRRGLFPVMNHPQRGFYGVIISSVVNHKLASANFTERKQKTFYRFKNCMQLKYYFGQTCEL